MATKARSVKYEICRRCGASHDAAAGCDRCSAPGFKHPPAVLEPPSLAIDRQMARSYGKTLSATGRVERRVVWNLLAHLWALGFKPAKVEEDVAHHTTSAAAVMEAVFSLDEAWVAFRSGGRGAGRVYIVLGNDGDCISDWTYTQGDPEGFDAAMRAFDAEAFK